MRVDVDIIVPVRRRGRRAGREEAPGLSGLGFGFLARAFICLSSFRSPHLPLPPLSPHFPTILSRPFTTSMPVTRDLIDRDPLSAALRPPIDETEEEKASRLAEEDAAKRVSHAIDEAIRIEKQQRRKHKTVRLLLLGQSESGLFLLLRRVRIRVYPYPSSQANLPPSAVSLSLTLWAQCGPGRAQSPSIQLWDRRILKSVWNFPTFHGPVRSVSTQATRASNAPLYALRHRHPSARLALPITAYLLFHSADSWRRVSEIIYPQRLP